MSQRTRVQLVTQIVTDLPDNEEGLISPEDVRNVLVNMLDSTYMPEDSGSMNANYAATASYVINSETSSYALNANSSSYSILAQTASYVNASAVVGLNLARIATGSITASVNIKNDIFSVVSGSDSILSVSSNYGFKQGYGVITSGSYSQAHGINTKALGDYSNVEGEETTTSNYAYLADSVINGIVTFNSSYGDVSYDILFIDDSIKSYIILDDSQYDNNEGYSVLQIVSASFNGTNTKIYLTNTSINTGNCLIAVISSISTQYKLPTTSQHAEGLNTRAIASYSHTEGYNTIASGINSHAEGYGRAIGGTSHAEALGISLGEISHAEGDNSVAASYGSHAEGGYNLAIGALSHAEGGYSTASGDYSHVEGLYNRAVGMASHAEGVGTIASGSYQHVQGAYNIPNTSSLMIIGNGVSGSRSNLAVFNSSSIEFSSSLAVSGSVKIGLSSIHGSVSSVSAVSGSNVILNIPIYYSPSTVLYTSFFCNYTVLDGTNARAGQIMCVWNNNVSPYGLYNTETTTLDIGSTAGISLNTSFYEDVDLTVYFRLILDAPTNWILKASYNLL